MTYKYVLNIKDELMPKNVMFRDAFFDEYFRSKLASYRKTEEGWEISLDWPSNLEYYVDPSVYQGVRWWSGRVISPKEIPLLRRGNGVYQESLNDSWTLYSWSLWVKNYAIKNGIPPEIILIHVDDHEDMMSPLQFISKGSLKDGITGKELDILEPSTIEAAINSGSVGIGDYITTFLFFMKSVHIRHLIFSNKNLDFDLKDIVLTKVEDPFLLDKSRPQITLSSRDVVECKKGIFKGTYKKGSNMDKLFSDLPNAPVLFHIDMDAFNNRFNACSDWKDEPHRHDLSKIEIINLIERVVVSVKNSELFRKIENITICLSPGFFPGEYWQDSLIYLRDMLKIHGFSVPQVEEALQGSKNLPNITLIISN